MAVINEHIKVSTKKKLYNPRLLETVGDNSQSSKNKDHSWERYDKT